MRRGDSPTPIAMRDVPIEKAKPPVETPPSGGYETSPVCVEGKTQKIRGPMDGDCSTTHVALDGRPARVIAETPRSVELPADSKPGAAKLELREKERRLTFPIVELRLDMSADKLDLLRGESTRYAAVVSGLEALPDSAWRGGVPLDADALARLRSEVPELRLPAPGEPGYLVLVIENRSRDVISISDERNGVVTRTFHCGDASAGKYGLDGSIHSRRSGGFNVHGEVFPLLAPNRAAGGGPLRAGTGRGRVSVL